MSENRSVVRPDPTRVTDGYGVTGETAARMKRQGSIVEMAVEVEQLAAERDRFHEALEAIARLADSPGGRFHFDHNAEFHACVYIANVALGAKNNARE